MTVPGDWKPECLCVLKGTQTLAISEMSKVFLIKLMQSLICAQLIQLVECLHSPQGLYPSPQSPEAILVADGTNVKEISLEDKQINLTWQFLEMAWLHV